MEIPRVEFPHHLFVSAWNSNLFTLNHGQTGVFFVLCGSFAPRAKPPCINARFWKPGPILLRSSLKFNIPKIAPSNNTCLVASFRSSVFISHYPFPIAPSYSTLCRNFLYFFAAFNNIPPILRHSEGYYFLAMGLNKSQYQIQNTIHAWGSCLPWLDYTSPKKQKYLQLHHCSRRFRTFKTCLLWYCRVRFHLWRIYSHVRCNVVPAARRWQPDMMFGDIHRCLSVQRRN